MLRTLRSAMLLFGRRSFCVNLKILRAETCMKKAFPRMRPSPPFCPDSTAQRPGRLSSPNSGSWFMRAKGFTRDPWITVKLFRILLLLLVWRLLLQRLLSKRSDLTIDRCLRHICSHEPFVSSYDLLNIYISIFFHTAPTVDVSYCFAAAAISNV